MRKNQKLLSFTLVLTLVFLMSTTTVFAADGEALNESLGFLTLLPPLVAIILALITKNVVISLFIGVLSGCFLVSIVDQNFISAILNSFLDFSERILGSLADPWNAGIILQVLVIGGVIALIARMGGAKAVALALAKRAKTAKSAQLTTWLLGLCVFFDDYANSLIVGPIMRPVTDKMRVSREKLSFILDATAAPISGIVIISTWVGYELSLIRDSFSQIPGGDTMNAMGIFVETIPFRFYNILMLIFIVFTAVLLREFGPMYRAEKRARVEGKLIADGATPLASDEVTSLEPKEGAKLSIWTAIVPIGILIFGSLIGFYYNGYTGIMSGEDAAMISLIGASPFSFEAIQIAFGEADASVVLFQSALLASIVAIIMGVSKKIFTFTEAIDTWVVGMKSLIVTGVILLLAWSLSSVIKDLGTANYLVQALEGHLPAFILPSLIFILGAVMSFATGTAYGTMGIIMPLAVPLAFALNPSMDFVIISTSAVLTGAIFGDHCSPISDTTILSSMGAASDHIDHTKTQFLYAIVVAIITVFVGYIPAGLGVSIYIVMPIAILSVFLVVRFIGKPVDDASLNVSKEKNDNITA